MSGLSSTLGERMTVNGLEHAMAKARHGGIGEAWMGFGHVSGEARRRAGHSDGVRAGSRLRNV
jgi:hypothetical protein